MSVNSAVGRATSRLDRLSERNFALIVSIPSFILIGLVVLPPIIATFGLSLFRIELAKDGNTPFVGLNNFTIRIPNDPLVMNAIPLTLEFAALITLVTLPLALVTALALNRRFRGDSFFFMILLMPWAISSIVTGIFWRLIFDVQFGLVNGVAVALGLMDANHPINWLLDTGANIAIAVVASSWRAIPLISLLLLASLKGIPQALYRAAKMDGATTFQAFRHVTIPAIRPTLTIVAILQIIISLQTFDILFSLTHGGPGFDTYVLVYTIYNAAFANLSFGEAAAITVVLFFIILACSVVLLAFLLRRRAVTNRTAIDQEDLTVSSMPLRFTKTIDTQVARAEGAWDAPRRRNIQIPPRVSRGLFGLGVVALGTFFLLPILWIVLVSLQPTQAFGNLPPALTTNLWFTGYQTIITDPRWQASLVVSLETAIITTALVLIFASPAAYSLARFNLRGKSVILGILIFTQLVPAIVMALPVLRLFQILHLTDTVQALVIVNVAFWLPLIVWLLRNFFLDVPVAIENAARIDGASRLGTLFRITIPAARPGIAAAAILILIGTWNEFLFAVVLGNQNAVTISRRIIGLNSFDFHGALNENPPPNLLASSGMIAVLPCLLLVLLFHRRIIAGVTGGLTKG